MTRQNRKFPDSGHGELASASGTRSWLVKLSWLTVPARLVRLAKPGGWPSRRGWLVIAPSVLVLFGLVAGVTYVVISSGPGPAPARLRPLAATGPNPDSTEPVPQYHVPAQVDPVALPSTGAIPLPTYEQPQAKTWRAGPGGAALKTVSNQAGAVSQAQGQKLYVEMKSACTQLASSVTAAQEAPPIPDTAMQALYQSALTDFATAAGQCKTAIFEQADGEEYVATTENQGALRAVAAALSSGSKDLFKATGEIATLDQS
jgi:hypothetical protein